MSEVIVNPYGSYNGEAMQSWLLWVVGYQLSVVDCRLSVMGCGLWVMGIV